MEYTMYLVKDAENMKSIFSNGHAGALDADARYTFSMAASCPRCGAEAFITRFERRGAPNQVFRCSSCFKEFGSGVNNILLH